MLSSIFISYSWEPDGARAWAEKLARALKRVGLEIRLDAWDLRLGADLLRYMESSVRESDYVLLICTPEFAAKANSGTGGVGYEKRVVSGELYHGSPEEKFIPILRAGSPADALPSYLKSKVYADLRVDADFDAGVRELALTLGAGSNTQRSQEPPWDDEVTARLDAKERLFEFANSRSGLGEPKWRAGLWADEWLDEWSLERLDEFLDAFEFGRLTMKKSRSTAEDFALEWLREYEQNEFYRYADLYEYLLDAGLRNSAAATAHLTDELIQLDDAEVRVFKKAYEVARSMGQSRADAESSALEEAEAEYR